MQYIEIADGEQAGVYAVDAIESIQPSKEGCLVYLVSGRAIPIRATVSEFAAVLGWPRDDRLTVRRGEDRDRLIKPGQAVSTVTTVTT